MGGQFETVLCCEPGCPSDASGTDPYGDLCDLHRRGRIRPRGQRAVEDMTMLDACLHVVQVDQASGKANPRSPTSVTTGLDPRPAPTKPGLHLLTPAQVAGLRLARVRVDETTIAGYQRDLAVNHARAIARRLVEGHPMPPILYAVDEHLPSGEIIDGQHRAAAAIIARQPIWAVCFEASRDERRKLFASQGAARKVSRSQIILAGSEPWHSYMHRALLDETHPWAGLIARGNGSPTRLGLGQAYTLICCYVCRTRSTAMPSEETLRERWDAARADELAPLLAAFGPKKANPHAYNARATRAIVSTAVLVVSSRADVQRWHQRAPLFPFSAYAHLSSSELAERMVEHWNRGLKTNRIARNAA